MDIIEKIAQSLNIPTRKVSSTIQLLEDDNTVPFIARYRKEATGGLDEEQIRQIEELNGKLKALDERRQAILKSIEEQGKLTPELQQQINTAETMTALEDLYAPYKPKRRTRAMIAREKGLQPLADLILAQHISTLPLEEHAKPHLNENVPTVEEALAGARDIVAETISDDAKVRQLTREKAMNFGTIQSEKTEDAADDRQVYETYYDYDGDVKTIRPHQVLAMNRGETEKVLKITVIVQERDWLTAIRTQYPPDRRSVFYDQLVEASEDCANRLLLPAIERDVRRALTERAEMHAIAVFSENLKALLSQPPLSGFVIMGIDPGFRTGSKIAIIDQTGKLLDTATIYPHPPQNELEKAKMIVAALCQKHHVNLIAIGNGTASRETEQMVADLIAKHTGIYYIIANEAGASVYSASKLAREEFPDLDVSIRGAVSIARRIQDPLAELVKIDPKSIGVGLYQHDVNQKQLAESLSVVVESVVNYIGVDINTASPALLTYISGIGPSLAEKMVEYRNKNGEFLDREKIKKVPGLGPKAYEQSAGFLRIRKGKNALDATTIHPESYAIAEKLMQKCNIDLNSSFETREIALKKYQDAKVLDAMAKELGTGVPTLKDIIEQLLRPGRDPREDCPKPILRSDVVSMDNLAQGMTLKGTVRNVVDFGAFVDIGVKTDGLLHRTRIPSTLKLSVGDIIDVVILDVNIDRHRISLDYARSQNKK